MNIPRVSQINRMTIGVLCFFVVLAIVPTASAAKVFLNGVDITKTNISNRNMGDDLVEAVLIDENGDVHIVAPGVNLKVTGQNRDQPPRDEDAMKRILGGPYVGLFFNENRGDIPYDVRLLVNGVEVKEFESDERTSVVDLSGYMQLGENRVQIIAERSGSSRGGAKDAKIRLVLGPGSHEGGRATVRRIRASMTIDSSTTDDRLVTTKSFTIEYNDHDDDDDDGNDDNDDK